MKAGYELRVCICLHVRRRSHRLEGVQLRSNQPEEQTLSEDSVC